jgi:hypothetical protein
LEISTEQFKEYQANKAKHLDLVGMHILSAITEDKLAEAPVNQLGTAYGILYDKARLERGQSTANIAHEGTIRMIRSRVSRLERCNHDTEADQTLTANTAYADAEESNAETPQEPKESPES